MLHLLKLYPDEYEQAELCAQAYWDFCNQTAADADEAKAVCSALARLLPPAGEEPRKLLIETSELEALCSGWSIRWFKDPNAYQSEQFRAFGSKIERYLNVRLWTI